MTKDPICRMTVEEFSVHRARELILCFSHHPWRSSGRRRKAYTRFIVPPQAQTAFRMMNGTSHLTREYRINAMQPAKLSTKNRTFIRQDRARIVSTVCGNQQAKQRPKPSQPNDSRRSNFTIRLNQAVHVPSRRFTVVERLMGLGGERSLSPSPESARWTRQVIPAAPFRLAATSGKGGSDREARES